MVMRIFEEWGQEEKTGRYDVIRPNMVKDQLLRGVNVLILLRSYGYSKFVWI